MGEPGALPLLQQQQQQQGGKGHATAVRQGGAGEGWACDAPGTSSAAPRPWAPRRRRHWSEDAAATPLARRGMPGQRQPQGRRQRATPQLGGGGGRLRHHPAAQGGQGWRCPPVPGQHLQGAQGWDWGSGRGCLQGARGWAQMRSSGCPLLDRRRSGYGQALTTGPPLLQRQRWALPPQQGCC